MVKRQVIIGNRRISLPGKNLSLANNSKEIKKKNVFFPRLYNESPVRNTVVANDRWGTDAMCKHGSFYTCADRFNPGILNSCK